MKNKKPFLWVPTIYYAEGFPFSLVRQVSVVFFKDLGASLESLGLVSLFGIPWTIKFLWGPAVDKYLTRRKWVIGAELLLAISALGLAACGFAKVPAQIAAAVFLAMAFLSATHDIAVDGFYIDALNKDDQAAYSGMKVAAYRLAMLTGSGALVALSAWAGWGGTFLVSAAILFCLMIWHFVCLPQAGEKAEVAHHQQVHFVDGFKKFLTLYKVHWIFLFALLFKIGDAMLFSMSTPFLLDAGLTKPQLGVFNGIFGTIAGISASIFGGWLISRFRLKKGLWYFGLIQNLAIPIYALVAFLKPPLWGYVAAIVVEQIAAGLGQAAYMNFLMRQNHPDYKATHYAIVTGLMALTTSVGGVSSGFLAAHFGYGMFFIIAFVASIPGMLILPWVSKRPECQ